MQVETTSRRRRTDAGAWKLPERVQLGDFSKAQGPWQVDWARAHADAKAVLDSIDFSRRDLVIWVPGTDGKGVHGDFARSVRDMWRGGPAPSLVAMQYEASWELRRSLPTGLATMKLVLEGIRARGGDHRVLLAGESQGGWIIGEIMADPKLRPLVTRAVTAGHPWLAKHTYEHGRDPLVRTINHEGDQVAMSVAGDIGVAMDAMSAVKRGAIWQNFGKVAGAILANPIHGVLILHNQLRATGLRPMLSDPHSYLDEMPRLAEFLATGTWKPVHPMTESTT